MARAIAQAALEIKEGLHQFRDGPRLVRTRSNALLFYLGPPIPRGVPGEGLDCRFPLEIWVLRPVRARDPGVYYTLNFHVGLKCSLEDGPREEEWWKNEQIAAPGGRLQGLPRRPEEVEGEGMRHIEGLPSSHHFPGPS